MAKVGLHVVYPICFMNSSNSALVKTLTLSVNKYFSTKIALISSIVESDVAECTIYIHRVGIDQH